MKYSIVTGQNKYLVCTIYLFPAGVGGRVLCPGRVRGPRARLLRGGGLLLPPVRPLHLPRQHQGPHLQLSSRCRHRDQWRFWRVMRSGESSICHLHICLRHSYCIAYSYFQMYFSLERYGANRPHPISDSFPKSRNVTAIALEFMNLILGYSKMKK